MSENIIQVGDIGELRDLMETERSLVVLFTAPSWCVPCQRFAPHFEAAAKSAQTDSGLAGGSTWVYVDIDKVPEVVVEYGVQGVPTTRFYADKGEFERDLRERTGPKFLAEVKHVS